ncbi:MAG: D-glycero-beta-D-manno-heptose 1-phosphate adenylyltransferase [Desulfobacteraceae bacterium]
MASKIITDKIVSPEEIAAIARRAKQKNKTIAFTNGCFDILHAGHVNYLNAAADLADLLILGLNSDASVKKIKGEKRPVIHETHRAVVLASLACISHIVIFDEPDPGSLIKLIVPDILVKGEDWNENEIIGADFVKQNGGGISRIPLEPDISTTAIIKKIRDTR